MKGILVCSQCGRELPLLPEHMVCPDCSATQKGDEPLRGVLEVRLSGELPENWENEDFLPVEKKWFPPIPVGNTPLWEPSRLREETGFPRLFLKDDTANPTGSLKDRASYLVAAFAKKHGVEQIVLASTGNAGSSMSGVGAAAGINIRLYLPASAPQAKMVQSLQYGADLVKVEGTYDEAFDESLKYTNEVGGLSRNTAYNPLTVEGKKTAALEIFKQLGKVPDYVFIPTGDGVIISGLFKGFEDLKTFGLIDRMPVLVAVQAEGSAALVRAFENDGFTPPVPSTTLADSISVDVPRGGYLALSKLKKHDGRVVTVSDDQILEAQKHLASKSGLFAEPASSAAWAGFMKMKGELESSASVVVLLTGSGLKDIEGALKGLR
ncbi:MAG: threonine synthase [Spirochaetales bacterium]|nr:threonine synthase [Spirochaetales bacterium]